MRLKHRVDLQKEDPTADSHGQLVAAWTTYRTCWANVTDGSGTETLRGDQVEATVSTEVHLMYPRQGRMPVPQDRVSYSEAGVARTLNVEAVRRSDLDRRMIVLACSEVQ